ncbi:hypothetical protein CCR75_006477 [Bremia lactucae]|uniref:Uncharacterized protein n=1 Tax=Bremia lactucae TaxID=4779 RepID=A0A976IC97_BRELC|nr:hypothetical protein CCR75_006477 [Bremia lactucae]
MVALSVLVVAVGQCAGLSGRRLVTFDEKQTVPAQKVVDNNKTVSIGSTIVSALKPTMLENVTAMTNNTNRASTLGDASDSVKTKMITEGSVSDDNSSRSDENATPYLPRAPILKTEIKCVQGVDGNFTSVEASVLNCIEKQAPASVVVPNLTPSAAPLLPKLIEIPVDSQPPTKLPEAPVQVPEPIIAAKEAETSNLEGGTLSYDFAVPPAGGPTNETTTTTQSSGGDEGNTPGQVHVSADKWGSVGREGSTMGEDKQNTIDTSIKETHDSQDHDSSTIRSKGVASNDLSVNSGDGGTIGLKSFRQPGTVTDINTSSATFDTLGTCSIIAIVGVVVGVVCLVIFYAISSRKTHTDANKDSPLPCNYKTGALSVARLSQAFMPNTFSTKCSTDPSMESVVVPPYMSSRKDGHERTMNYHTTIAPTYCDQVADDRSRNRVQSCHLSEFDTENDRMSAMFSSESSILSESEVSDSWSSVLASDTYQQPLRNTRDTTLSDWSGSSFSNFESTGNTWAETSSAYSTVDLRQTDSTYQSRQSSCMSDMSRFTAGNRSTSSTEF